jgi:non-specific serine/threonine protein kinase/serine/threonine-protein kinase
MELFVQVCEGVQHSHQKAILHRDLKPSNILVSDVDGKPMPKIIDFGLAKAISHRLTAGTMYTRMGAILGTVEYMSPEQADSAGEDIDTRSDVYSLGVVLYQLLVGALWSMGYQSMPSWEWIKIPTFSPYMATRDSRL